MTASRDLIDLLLLRELEPDLAQVVEACRDVFNGRAKQLWPPELRAEPSWPEQYRALAEEQDFAVDDVAQAVERGAGAVGTGSIRGMPFLLSLASAGFTIWPFDPTGWPRVVEIYPRELTGKVNKSSRAARQAYLKAAFPELEVDGLTTASGSEDAFDAAVSALVMDRNVDELAALEQTTDPYHALEGAIWQPTQEMQVPPISIAAVQEVNPPVAGWQARTLAKPVCSLNVKGRPATFATAHEARWNAVDGLALSFRCLWYGSSRP
jgi:hypothetical protein